MTQPPEPSLPPRAEAAPPLPVVDGVHPKGRCFACGARNPVGGLRETIAKHSRARALICVVGDHCLRRQRRNKLERDIGIAV